MLSRPNGVALSGIANSLSLCRSPTTGQVAIKRVIALEGDSVQTRAPYPFPIADVPKGHVWVEGDNKDGNKTLDSMHYGPISMNLIEGRVTRVLWPWRASGKIMWEEWKGRTKVYQRRSEDGTRR
jgi:inner membrane protease subunit 2